jgi:hypothetical protein
VKARANRYSAVGIHGAVALFDTLDDALFVVRQSANREKLPDVLELDELKKLLAELENPARALVF